MNPETVAGAFSLILNPVKARQLRELELVNKRIGVRIHLEFFNNGNRCLGIRRRPTTRYNEDPLNIIGF